VDVHQPERWGYIQFSTDVVNATSVRKDPDFSIRSVAMQLYYAEHAFFAVQNRYTDNINELAQYLTLGKNIFLCVNATTIISDNTTFTVSVAGLNTQRVATVTDDRYLLVH